MKNDKIRFHWMMFDWVTQTIDMKFIVGTQDQGGYEDKIKISFQMFEELVDTSKLRNILEEKSKIKEKSIL